MKTLSLCSFLFLSLFSFNSFGQTASVSMKTDTIKTWGNCGMCKSKIEKAARNAGASEAVWNPESKELQFSYAVNKTSGEQIQKAIAAAGYDTEDFTADSSTYNKLHGCCKYERKETKSDTKKACCSGAESCSHHAADKAEQHKQGCKEKCCNKD